MRSRVADAPAGPAHCGREGTKGQTLHCRAHCLASLSMLLWKSAHHMDCSGPASFA